MSEIELAKYCRQNGYYVEDVKSWRDSCITANEQHKEDSIVLREELNKEKKKAKNLEKEIKIKDKIHIVKLIKEAHSNGARLIPACKITGISKRTYERWLKDGEIQADKRTTTIRQEPTNKLTKEERQSILNIVSNSEFADLPPSQIVPALADRGVYIASESTMYRIFREENMQ